MKRDSRRTLRRGSSLIEMVVLITLIAFTLTAMSMLTHAILKSSQQFVTTAQVRQVHARFLDQLNRDAMEAAGDTERPRAENAELRFTLQDGKRVEYRVTQRTVDREVFSALGEIEQHEQFRLPPRYQFVSVGGASTDADGEIQIREELGLQQDGSPQVISTGLRVIIFPAQRAPKIPEARP